jgi:hypothetical protein
MPVHVIIHGTRHTEYMCPSGDYIWYHHNNIIIRMCRAVKAWLLTNTIKTVGKRRPSSVSSFFVTTYRGTYSSTIWYFGSRPRQSKQTERRLVAHRSNQQRRRPTPSRQRALPGFTLRCPFELLNISASRVAFHRPQGCVPVDAPALAARKQEHGEYVSTSP